MRPRARGIPVFNAPFSNTRSVAELVIGEIVMLLRRIFSRSVSAHEGGWDKSATDSLEVRGKTLGIVGYGNIGSQLSTLAEGMGMKVIYFDITDKLRHGNTEPCATLDELLGQADVVSMHVPETPQTKNMMGEAQFKAMKKGAFSSITRAERWSISTRWPRRSRTSICAAPPSTSSPRNRRAMRINSCPRCRAWKT